MKPAEAYILRQLEPYQSIMLYVRSVIFKVLPNVEERYSYSIPFYYHNKKPMLYFNILKGTTYVDVAFMYGILLEADFPELKNDNKRKQVRSLQVKHLEDLDEEQFSKLLKQAAMQLDKGKKAWDF